VAAPSLVSVSFVEGVPASGASLSTPTSVSWLADDVVVLIAGTEGGGSESWAVPTTTGTGLTIAQQQLHASASNCGAGCWGTVASAGSSGTFGIKQPATGTAEHVMLAALVFRGSAGVGSSNVAASSSRTLSLTPTGADGAIVWGVFDWGANAVVAATPTATTHSTSSPGPQAEPQALLVSPHYTYYFEELDDQTSAGAVSYGIGGSGTGPYTIIAVEVKAAGGGAAAPNPRVPRMSPVPIIRAANF
jgi:hypothetical protein